MEEQVIYDYTHNILAIGDLCKKYNKGQESIYNILDSNNIQRYSRSESAMLRRVREKGIQDELKDIEKKIISNYQSGLGQIASGREFGLSIRSVKRVLKKYNIPIRNQSEAAAIANKSRTKSKNEDYFDEESSNMAYILGFIAADGSISSKNNTIKIGLSSIDRKHLEKIKREIEIENKIVDYTTNNGFEVSELKWTSKRHKQMLAKYNVLPQKTFDLTPPYQLDSKYYIDYIRGYFDGDGSINLIKNGNGRGQGNIRWQIGAGSKLILTWIIDILERRYNIKSVNIYTRNKPGYAPFYYFQYSSVSSRSIHKILYTKGSLYLTRKKENFDKYCSLFE